MYVVAALPNRKPKAQTVASKLNTKRLCLLKRFQMSSKDGPTEI